MAVEATEDVQAMAGQGKARSRDPHYDVSCRVRWSELEEFAKALVARGDDVVVVLVSESVRADTREAAVDEVRGLLPEELGFREWGTMLSGQVKWQTVEDPYAAQLAAVVPVMMDLSPELDEQTARVRAREALKRADQS